MRAPCHLPPQIYEVCASNGRIAYKRAGGSRLITANDHWKSQIRHALYTGDRFQRWVGGWAGWLGGWVGVRGVL